jgi:hypothetical protein
VEIVRLDQQVSAPPMKRSFVLIDFENVQPANVPLLRGVDCKVMVFLGANQTRLPTHLVCELQSLGPNATYVRIDGSGRNALDFHIAFYLGELAAQHPDAEFHIISNDTGFDPLIRHMKSRKLDCQRLASLADIPGLKSKELRSASDPVQKVTRNWSKCGGARPRTVRTLRSMIKALLGSQTTDEAVGDVVAELQTRAVLKLAEGKVHYLNL